MLQEWDTVQEEAETLKGELREDKWLAVFRTVGEQAEAMMVSLEKAVAHCQEFIWQVGRNRKALTEDGQSGISSGSFSADKPMNYEMFQSLQSSYEAKKRYAWVNIVELYANCYIGTICLLRPKSCPY